MKARFWETAQRSWQTWLNPFLGEADYNPHSITYTETLLLDIPALTNPLAPPLSLEPEIFILQIRRIIESSHSSSIATRHPIRISLPVQRVQVEFESQQKQESQAHENENDNESRRIMLLLLLRQYCDWRDTIANTVTCPDQPSSESFLRGG